jgi:hypothetical protein
VAIADAFRVGRRMQAQSTSKKLKKKSLNIRRILRGGCGFIGRWWGFDHAYMSRVTIAYAEVQMLDDGTRTS